MENLLDYLIYALMGQDPHLVSRSRGTCGSIQWLLNFGYHKDVALILDESDIRVIRDIAANRTMDDDERERYEMLFELCQ